MYEVNRTPADDLYERITAQRNQDIEVTAITVPRSLYVAVYEFYHKFCLGGEVVLRCVGGKIDIAPGPHFPLPVPEDGYRCLGVDVRCADKPL